MKKGEKYKISVIIAIILLIALVIVSIKISDVKIIGDGTGGIEAKVFKEAGNISLIAGVLVILIILIMLKRDILKVKGKKK